MLRHALRAFLMQQGLLDEGAPDSAVPAACIEFLAASPAAVVLINLEDLWGEEKPQNTPGTSSEERPNWRQKTLRRFEDFSRDPSILALMQRVAKLRGESSDLNNLSALDPRRTS
jgi:4-alpha-glucanotransferase